MTAEARITPSKRTDGRRQYDTPVEIIGQDLNRHPGCLGAPGTAIVFVGLAGGLELKQAHQAAIDATVTQDLVRCLVEAFSTPKLEFEEAVALVESQPTHAELVLGADDHRLAEALYPASDANVAVVILPYTGGHLESQDLRLRQWVLPGYQPTLEAVAIVTPPGTSPSEQYLNAFSPSEDLPVLGAAIWCETTWRAILVLAAIAAGAGLAVLSTSDVTPIEEQDPLPTEVEFAKGGASIDELLSRRLAVLQRQS